MVELLNLENLNDFSNEHFEKNISGTFLCKEKLEYPLKQHSKKIIRFTY
jgi:hypothetical protein